ncbi:hypothetical protein ACLMJK_006627 [Lecanora helva]
MPHADPSNFASSLSKPQVYDKLLEEAAALFEGQRNWDKSPSLLIHSSKQQVCNLSNASSLLYHAYRSLPPPSSAVNWAGFYILDRTSPSPSLILGPFQGRPACQSIAFGKGVCGTAAKEKKVVRVDDVREFEGHIACDGGTRSEIVVPIFSTGGEVVGVIDVDCENVGGFDSVDEEGLIRLAALIADSCDRLGSNLR